MTDAELRALTDEYKARLKDGETTDDLLPEAFATVREAAKRVRGMRHYHVQLMGGAALHQGNIAEMKTGEGKTLVSTLPVYLNGLNGKGVHQVTVNDYLVRRDAEWMGEIHRFLGLSVGIVLPGEGSDKHRAAYDCRHHVLHEQRARVRLPARQHDQLGRQPGAARPPLRARRRSRLDPRRRGPYPDHHLRARRAPERWYSEFAEIVRSMKKRRALRGRRGQAHHRDHRVRRRPRRGPPGHREPVRLGEHPAGRLPQQRDQGPGAVREEPRVHRLRGRRGPHRRRVHRPRAAGPPLQRGHPPGHRGEGRGGDQAGEPDLRDHHPAELLPHVRQDRGHHRYRPDRGRRSSTTSTAWASSRSRRTSR